MPLTLSDLAKDITPIALDFAGDVLHLEVFTKRLTPALLADLSALEHGGVEATQHAVALLLKLVKRWDLEEEPGVPLPLTLEKVALLPLELLGAVIRGVLEQLSLTPQNGASSNGA